MSAPAASSSDNGEREQDAKNGQGQAGDNIRHRGERGKSDPLNLDDLDPLTPSRSSSTERDEDSENEEDPLPGSGEAHTTSLTVREAIGGLFSTHTNNVIASSGSQ